MITWAELWDAINDLNEEQMTQPVVVVDITTGTVVSIDELCITGKDDKDVGGGDAIPIMCADMSVMEEVIADWDSVIINSEKQADEPDADETDSDYPDWAAEAQKYGCMNNRY